jgi:hypothetical protein
LILVSDSALRLSNHWLADGFHHINAYSRLGVVEVAADVRQGTRRDAVLYSCGANATHGYPQSNADKRRAVLTLLNDPEWSAWSNVEIASRCHVSEFMVREHRASLRSNRSERRYRTKHDTESTMNTAEIGKRAAEPAAPPEPDVPSIIVMGRVDADQIDIEDIAPPPQWTPRYPPAHIAPAGFGEKCCGGHDKITTRTVRSCTTQKNQ